jgi:hypothetical protein
VPRRLALRLSAVAVLLIMIFCSGSSISDQSSYASASSTSADGWSMTNFLPFLPHFPTSGDGIEIDHRINLTSDTGSLTIKKVKVGSSEQIGNATLMFTPNPYTLRNSLNVTDNSMADSDPSDGSFQLNNVGFGSYIINETMPPEGYGPILSKTRVAVLPTNQNLVVTIENRNINIPFEGTAIVTPPSLNATAFESFVRNGATVGNLSIKKVDALPSGFIENTETEETEVRQDNRDIQPVVFNASRPANTSASEIYESLKIPTYPAPVKNISSSITYLSPVFVVPQDDEGNGSFLLTPIIAKTFPGMSLLIEQPSSTARKIAEVESILMRFAKESSNVGFSFGISDSIPNSLMLPKPPTESLKFFDVDFVGTTTSNQYTNFSNTGSFSASPQMGIVVDKNANISKLDDGCPDIKLFTLDESGENMWQKLSEPTRDKTHDNEYGCAYILDLQHFSKFSVGGVRPSSSQTLE